MSQTVDLCAYSQYNAEVSGRIQRGSDRTSCKVNKWFLEGVEANSKWLKRDFPVAETNQQILPVTAQNQGNLPIGNPNEPVSYTVRTTRSKVDADLAVPIDYHHHSRER